MTRYEKAFLDTLAWAEGTLGVSNNGYDVLVNDNAKLGSRIVVGWTPTTDIIHGLGSWAVNVGGVRSTAAGRYQFIGSTWVELNNKVNVPMTKVNQDASALKKLNKLLGSNYKYNINSVNDMAVVASKIKSTWSSFSVKTPSALFEIYQLALGKYPE